MESMSREMYQEEILDLYKNPHNFGRLDNATHMHNEFNPLCGDDITIQLMIKNNKVGDVKFYGHGCAISMASTSLLTDKIKGLNIKQIKEIKAEDIIKMLNIPIGPVRIKCALLSLIALHKTIGV